MSKKNRSFDLLKKSKKEVIFLFIIKKDNTIVTYLITHVNNFFKNFKKNSRLINLLTNKKEKFNLNLLTTTDYKRCCPFIIAYLKILVNN